MEQRVIKFRCWDTANNEWFQNNAGFAISQDGFELVDDNEKLHRLKEGRLVVSQFTGLLDKNGKEVYEGDIVIYDSEHGVVKAKIIFKDSEGEDLWVSGFRFEVIDITEYTHDNPIEFEIIGNIYENPELLNQLSNNHSQ